MLNPDIRDQAYQFFIEEAPDLLQAIEGGLLTLRQERGTAKVHTLMRAAHSIKGAATGVELEAIATLAHRVENIFKALYDETIEIDINLETQLLQAYDCLRLPLIEQIQTGEFDADESLAIAEPIFAQIEERLGEAMSLADYYIPSSADLGVDMAKSIFEVDVAQGLERLARVVAEPSNYEVAGELRAQAEVFAGFAELLNEPEFGAIAQTALHALDAHPARAHTIAQLALTDLQVARQVILAGKEQGTKPKPQAIAPSQALLNLAHVEATPVSDISGDTPELFEELEQTVPLLENVFSTEFDERSLELGSGEWENLDGDSELPEEDSSTLENQQLLNSSESLTVEPSNLPFGNAKGEQPSNLPTFQPSNLEETVQAIAQIFEELPPLQETPTPKFGSNPSSTNAAGSLVPVQPIYSELSQVDDVVSPSQPADKKRDREAWYDSSNRESSEIRQGKASPVPNLSVRVDAERLERMNNLVGELAINRNGLSLQNEQLQGSVRDLLNRYARVQNMVGRLRKLSDKMLVDRPLDGYETIPGLGEQFGELAVSRTNFDFLELDRYGTLHSQLQGLLEDMVSLEETVDDIVLFARATDRNLEQQRQMLTQLRDELMWARMVPLGEVLNRFPRILRNLSTTYNKPVNLKLSGTGVLVDKAALEKLYDPLLHMLRNAFDHGIEPPHERRQRGKPEEGQIEICAYHRGNQTIIEVRDDGRGLELEGIRHRALELGLLSADQLETTAKSQLYEFIFEPGFSTAARVSELSGRGVGLDVVRTQMRSLKGTISVSSEPGVGTTFILRLPLTLTIAKLLVCFVGSTALALPSDSIQEIVIPKPGQVKHVGTKRFLSWWEQVVPIYRLAEALEYNCPLPDTSPSKALVAVPSPEDWAPPLLVLSWEQQVVALEVERLVTEQELVIKPFGEAIAPPSCTYGCTILGDGSLIPVLDGAALLHQVHAAGTQSEAMSPNWLHRSTIKTAPAVRIAQAPTVLVVDDAAALRRTLALTLERNGCRVLQARDGREAIEQLKQTAVKLVVCDIEMPNMNGFEFLNYRRQDSELCKIPVVMLTSRSNDKHRWLAMQLGADGYFTKPYLEQEFLAAIAGILRQSQPESMGILQPSC